MRKIIKLFVVLFFIFILTGCEMPSIGSGNTKTKLETPNVLVDETGLVTWSEVAYSSRYCYQINDEVAIYTTKLSTTINVGDKIRVKAVGDGILYRDSLWSEYKTVGEYVKTLFNVNFYDENDKIIKTFEVEEGKSVEFVYHFDNVVVDGYSCIFSAWDKDLSHITSNLEVYPVFVKPSNYSVVFYDQNNNIIKSYNVAPGTTLSDSVVNTITINDYSDDTYYYTFVGWDKNLKLIKSNLDVYPIFEKEAIVIENRLQQPKLLLNDNGAISWEKIDNASSYQILVNDIEELSTTNTFIFLEENDVVKVKAIDDENCFNDSLWSNEVRVSIKTNKTDLRYNIKDLYENHTYYLDASPSTGDVSVLVIPVWFNDSATYIKTSHKESIRQDINTAFFGTTIDTKWHSVKSYYYEDSYGLLNIDGMVTDWYNSGVNGKNISEQGVDNLVNDALNWVKNTYSTIDFSEYDKDNNGLIDSLCLIYGYPNCDTINSNNDNLWAYVYWLQDETVSSTTNPGANTYLFASYDFMYGTGGGDTSHVDIDAHTYIHEMGHVFGLNDYYDYSGTSTPAGGFSMQDSNVGGHDPYSKMLLDWVDPYVVTNTTTLTIKPFTESGDVILISPNPSGSVFDEYLLIELYTSDGLNELDSLYNYANMDVQGPNDFGIRIWHVDARLGYVSDYNDYLSANQITTEISNRYYYGFANTNTYPASGFDDYVSEIYSFRYYNELQLIRNDRSTDYKCNYVLDSTDLFKTGDTFSMSLFQKQFYNKGLLNSKQNLGYTIEFVNVTEDGATITITKQ